MIIHVDSTGAAVGQWAVGQTINSHWLFVVCGWLCDVFWNAKAATVVGKAGDGASDQGKPWTDGHSVLRWG